MKQSIQDVELLMEEMDGMRAALTESETKNSNLKSSLINMVIFQLSQPVLLYI